MDMTRSSIADFSLKTENSTTVSYQSERDVKGASHVAEEFQAETSRLRHNRRQVSLQSRRKQVFSAWTPSLIANNPARSEDGLIKSAIPSHINDGGAGSSDVPKQSQSEIGDAGNTDNSQVRDLPILLLRSLSYLNQLD